MVTNDTLALYNVWDSFIEIHCPELNIDSSNVLSAVAQLVEW